MEIEKKLLNDIEAYCKLNGLSSEDFINSLIKKAFNLEKYGEKPPMLIKKEKKIPEKVIVSYEIEVTFNEVKPESSEIPTIQVDQAEKPVTTKTRKRKLS